MKWFLGAAALLCATQANAGLICAFQTPDQLSESFAEGDELLGAMG